jgi:hypothetical protein
MTAIEKYSSTKHFQTLRRWNDVRGQVGLEHWMLPDLGFVAGDRAIAFLVTTNSPVAWIAHWTVDPELSKEQRDQVLDVLAAHIERVAKEKGFQIVQTLGKVGHNLSQRLEDRGYLSAPGPFTFYVKDIRS